jgi:type II secretory pathway component PulF
MGSLMVVIFTVVFPKMLKILTGLGSQLPLPTKIMIVASGFMQRYFLLIAALAVALVVAYQFAKTYPAVTEAIDRLLLKIPVVGSLIQKINLSRYFKIIATLHASGLNVEKTFHIAADVVSNTVIAGKLRAIPKDLVNGDSISDSMRRTGLIQDLAIDMISIAEKTGRLDDALNRSSEILDKEVPETLKKLVALIEPLTMIMLGGLVLLLLLSVFLPIYKVAGSMKVR